MKEKYCTALTKRCNQKLEREYCEEYYLCGITQRPCIAREIIQISYHDYPTVQDICRAGIDEETLPSCPAWNLPLDKIRGVLELRLEETLKQLK